MALAETNLSLNLPLRFCPLIHFSFNKKRLPSAGYVLVVDLFFVFG